MSNKQLFSTGEKSWQKLNVKGIEATDDRVCLEFVKAEDVLQEFTQILFTIDGVTNAAGGHPWTTSFVNSAGDIDYVGELSGVGPAAVWNFKETGFYSISIRIEDAEPTLQPGETIQLSFEDDAGPSTCDIVGLLSGEGEAGEKPKETISGMFRPITTKDYKIRARFLNGAGTQNGFTGCMFISRIK